MQISWRSSNYLHMSVATAADKPSPHKMHREEELGKLYLLKTNLDAAEQIHMSSLNFKICP